ncbi:zinc ribbon domain-containing protein [Euryarchaeota archaeon]|nr:zinc ribbon domain-containing protein [Euryarchaeota archaeon]
MGFCINCGQQHQDGIRFCRFCGNQQPGDQLLMRLRQEAEQIHYMRLQMQAAQQAAQQQYAANNLYQQQPPRW